MTCCNQQLLIKDALPSLGDDVVMVSIDGDPNEDADLLRQYADALGLQWRFAVAPRELMSELAASFGNGVLYPPSDPMFVVSADGNLYRLPTGIKDGEFLREVVDRHRGETHIISPASIASSSRLSAPASGHDQRGS